MLLYVLFFGILFGSLIIAVTDTSKKVKKEPHNHQPISPVKLFLKNFLSNLTILTIVSTICFFMAALILLNFPGDKQVTVSEETFTLGESTVIDTSTEGSFRFIAERPNNLLEPKIIYYESLFFESTDIKEVVVQKNDQYHTWFSPIPLQTDTIVVLK